MKILKRLFGIKVFDVRNNHSITHERLILVGYTHYSGTDYCAPYPANGGTYRLELKATQYTRGKSVKGTEEWRAFIMNKDLSTIRRFKTMGELKDFHKGMCGGVLF